jgi:hypothetical protein
MRLFENSNLNVFSVFYFCVTATESDEGLKENLFQTDKRLQFLN